jgi:hypothetical protein
LGTLGNSTSSTKPKPSTPPSDEIVELAPPPSAGFSGTAKFLSVSQAPMIEELIRRGYTRVAA